MGALTEREIFSMMTDRFRLAAQLCDDLAKSPVSGVAYRQLMQCCKELEGTCRQAGAWRQDCRWYDFGMMVEAAHKQAGNWLRGAKDPETGRPVRLSEAHRFSLFTKLANVLRAAEARAIECRDKKTGRVGMILPGAYDKPKLVKHPVEFRNPSLILPPGYVAA